MTKKLLIFIIANLLLGSLGFTVQAAENGTAGPGRSKITVLGGTDLISEGNFQLSKSFDLTEAYEDQVLKLGIMYRASDSFMVNAGIRYDFTSQSSVPFGKVDAKIPFGDNLKIAGYAAQNYYGVDWTSYEVAIQIEVFKNLFVFPGVRGEYGNTVPTYAYNPNNEPYLFLRGDFQWKAGKFDFLIQPYLYICGEGVWFHNYSIKYNVNEKIALMVNTNTLFDQSPKFLAGLQWKL